MLFVLLLQVEADKQADRIISVFVQKRQIDVLASRVHLLLRNDSKIAGLLSIDMFYRYYYKLQTKWMLAILTFYYQK